MKSKQLINFVLLRQDDGQEIMMKYMLVLREPNTFGVLAEKHIVLNGEMHFEEECETEKSYDLPNALAVAETFASGKVLPTTYWEIEKELLHENR